MDVGVAIGEPVQDAIHEGVVEGTGALPEVEGDVIVVETEEELVPGDSGEDEFDVSEEDNGGIGSVRSVTWVGDVREEGVYGVKRLSSGLTGPLGGSEKAGFEGVVEEGDTETTLVDHEHCVG